MSALDPKILSKLEAQSKRRKKAFEREVSRINRRRAKISRKQLKREAKLQRQAQRRAEALAKNAERAAKLAIKNASDTDKSALEALVEQRKQERIAIEQMGSQLRTQQREKMKETGSGGFFNFTLTTASSSTPISSTSSLLPDDTINEYGTPEDSVTESDYQSESSILDAPNPQSATDSVNSSLLATDIELTSTRRELDRQRRANEKDRARAEKLARQEEEARSRAEEAERKLAERLEKEKLAAERVIARRQGSGKQSLWERRRASKESTEISLDNGDSSSSGAVREAGVSRAAKRAADRAAAASERRKQRAEAEAERKIERERIAAEKEKADADRKALREYQKEQQQIERARIKAESAQLKEKSRIEKSEKKEALRLERDQRKTKQDTFNEESGSANPEQSSSAQEDLTSGYENPPAEESNANLVEDTTELETKERANAQKLEERARNTAKREAGAEAKRLKRAAKSEIKAQRKAERLAERSKSSTLQAERQEQRNLQRAEKREELLELKRVATEEKQNRPRRSLFRRTSQDAVIADTTSIAEDSTESLTLPVLTPENEIISQGTEEKDSVTEISNIAGDDTITVANGDNEVSDLPYDELESNLVLEEDLTARKAEYILEGDETSTIGQSAQSDLSDRDEGGTSVPTPGQAEELLRDKEELSESKKESSRPRPAGLLRRLFTRTGRGAARQADAAANTVPTSVELNTSTSVYSESTDNSVDNSTIEEYSDPVLSGIVGSEFLPTPDATTEEIAPNLFNEVTERDSASVSRLETEQQTPPTLEKITETTSLPTTSPQVEQQGSGAPYDTLEPVELVDTSIADLLDSQLAPLDNTSLKELTAILPSTEAIRMTEWIQSLPGSTQQRLTFSDITTVAALWRQAEQGVTEREVSFEIEELVEQVKIRPISGPVITYASTSVVEEKEERPKTFSLFRRSAQEPKQVLSTEDKAAKKAEARALREARKLELAEQKAEKKAKAREAALQKKELKLLQKEERERERAEARTAKSERALLTSVEATGKDLRNLRRIERKAAKQAAREHKQNQGVVRENESKPTSFRLVKSAKSSTAPTTEEVSSAPQNPSSTDSSINKNAERLAAKQERAAAKEAIRQQRADAKAVKNSERTSSDSDEPSAAEQVFEERSRSARARRKELRALAKEESKYRKSELRARSRQSKVDKKAERNAEVQRRTEQQRLDLERRANEARARAAQREIERITRKSLDDQDVRTPEDHSRTGRYSWEVETGATSAGAIGAAINHLDYDLPEPLPRH
jgi:hypothetical protein